MIEIKPGPELDQAVAEAIGWTPPRIPPEEHPKPLPLCPLCDDYRHPSQEVEDWRSDWFWREPGNGPCWTKPKEFSRDLNTAFAAAEAFKLFDKDGYDAMLAKDDVDGRWEVLWITDDVDSMQADTPALAICAAILKIKESACCHPNEG
jgi:hypothetical protein